LIIHNGEVLAMRSTAANENDRTPIINLCKTLTEKLYADKEYIGKALTKELKDSGIDILTTVPNNMRAKVISAFDKAVLSKRYIIETIDYSLEKTSQVKHNRHRYESSFMLNVISGVVAYCLKTQKPHIMLAGPD